MQYSRSISESHFTGYSSIGIRLYWGMGNMFKPQVTPRAWVVKQYNKHETTNKLEPIILTVIYHVLFPFWSLQILFAIHKPFSNCCIHFPSSLPWAMPLAMFWCVQYCWGNWALYFWFLRIKHVLWLLPNQNVVNLCAVLQFCGVVCLIKSESKSLLFDYLQLPIRAALGKATYL